MKTPLLVLAFVLSSLSLGVQIKNGRTAPLFDKYLVAARISECDYPKTRANTQMIQDSAIMNDGVGVPHVFSLSDDHQRIICWVVVSEKDLPKSHDEQKKVLEMAAWTAVGAVDSAFDVDPDKSMPHAVKVEFRSIEGIVKIRSRGRELRGIQRRITDIPLVGAGRPLPLVANLLALTPLRAFLCCSGV